MLGLPINDGVAPGGGSSGFTAAAVLVADAAGAINDGPSLNYDFTGNTSSDLTLRFTPDGVGSLTTLRNTTPTAAGQVGWDLQVIAGTGAAGSGGTAGGAGASAYLSGGNGGAGVAGAVAGVGGDVIVAAGAAGANGGGGGANGGSVYVDAADGTGAGAAGSVYLGTQTVTTYGTLSVIFGANILPNATGTLDIGSASFKVRDIHTSRDVYVGANAIFLLGNLTHSIGPADSVAVGVVGARMSLYSGTGANASGATAGQVGGTFTINGGVGGDGAVGLAPGVGGAISITGGPAGVPNGATGNPAGGAVSITGGGGRNTGAGGAITITGGTNTGSGVGGDVTIVGGTASTNGSVNIGTSGTLSVFFGVNFLPNADGTLDIGSTTAKVRDIHTSRDVYVGDDVEFLLGVAHDLGVATSTAATIVGGALNVFAGTGAVAQGASAGAVGGALALNGGVGGAGITGVSPGDGGAVAIAGGAGGARINSGASSGGAVTITGGNAAGNGAGNGGSITLTAGGGGVTGTAGSISLVLGTSDGVYDSAINIAATGGGTVNVGTAAATVVNIGSSTSTVGIGVAAGTPRLTVGGSLSPSAGADGYIASFGGTLVEAASGTHAVMAGAAFLAPTLTPGAAATTVLANAYVAANPTGGTNNVGLFSDGTIQTANGIAYNSKAPGGGSVHLISVGGDNFIYLCVNLGLTNGVVIEGGGGNIVLSAPVVRVSTELELDGAFNHDGTTFGALGAVPAVQVASVAVATDAATTQTLANALRTHAINHGFMAAV